MAPPFFRGFSEGRLTVPEINSVSPAAPLVLTPDPPPEEGRWLLHLSSLSTVCSSLASWAQILQLFFLHTIPESQPQTVQAGTKIPPFEHSTLQDRGVPILY